MPIKAYGVGVPEPHERSSASISDGYDAMPGNYVRPTQTDDVEGTEEGAGADAVGELGTSSGSAGAADDGCGPVAPTSENGGPTSETHAANPTELHSRAVSRQTVTL